MTYIFDDFVIDPSAFELRAGGELAPIEPMALSLIIHLVENQSRIVTRDELVERIWLGRSVSDAAISSCIKTARQALGDDGKTQRLIRTIHGRGFRFVGNVLDAGAPSAAPQHAAAPSEQAASPCVDVRCPDGVVAPQEPLAAAVRILDRPAVIVLPFRNGSDDAQEDYLADGLTDDLIGALSAWRWFPVISRNTSFRYRHSDKSPEQIWRETGARYILNGDIVCSGARARTSVELMDAENGLQVWRTRIVRERDEIFSLQDDLATSIVGALVPELRSAELQRILRKATDDLTAWDYALKASWHINRWTDADFDAAERFASAAARRDPAWGYPQSLTAFVAFQRALVSWSAADARTAFSATLEAANAALQVDDGSWIAHALSGIGELWTNRNFDKALAHLARALDTNPSASWTYHLYGCVSGFAGNLETAIAHQEKVFQLDPAHPFPAVVQSDLALWRMLEGELDAAKVHIDRALEWEPDYARGVQRLVALHGLRGERDAAYRAIERLSKLSGSFDSEYFQASYPFRKPEHRKTFMLGLTRAGLNVE